MDLVTSSQVPHLECTIQAPTNRFGAIVKDGAAADLTRMPLKCLNLITSIQVPIWWRTSPATAPAAFPTKPADAASNTIFELVQEGRGSAKISCFFKPTYVGAEKS
jgi:hypothetical protein